MAGLVVIVDIFVCGMIGLWLYQSRNQLMAQAADRVEALSSILTENLSGFIARVDMTLTVVEGEITREQQTHSGDAAMLDRFIASMDAHLPEALGIRIIDAQGNITNAVDGVVPGRSANIADFEHFIQMRQTPSNSLVITDPLIGRLSGRWLISFARRHNNSDGSFGGLVQVAVPIDHFIHLFSEAKLGPYGVVSLYNDQSKIVARYPAATSGGVTIGKAIISAELKNFIQSKQAAVSAHIVSPVDQTTRTLRYHKIGDHPLFLVVGLGDDDFLLEWRHQALIGGGFAALFIVFTTIAAWITARIWMRQLELAAFNQDIIENAPLGILVYRSDGLCISANPAAARLLGGEAEVLLKFNFNELESWRRAGMTEVAQRVMAGGGGEGGNFAIVTSFERALTLACHFSQIQFGSRPHLLLMFEDVTTRAAAETALREKTEQLLQSNADLEQFAYVASHDLQTPLRNVVRYAQLLEHRYKNRIDSDADDFIGFIVDNGKHMTYLINDLLDFSRVTRQSAPPRQISAGDAVAQALKNLDLELVTTGGEVTIGSLPTVVADQTFLVSLFQNLLGNGLKYRAPDRKPVLSVDAVRVSVDLWRFAVSDNGIGIEPEYHDKIFEIFQRLDPASDADGTGIGLTLCRRIVHRFGGTIWLTSEPGFGTTFFFTLRDGSAAT